MHEFDYRVLDNLYIVILLNVFLKKVHFNFVYTILIGKLS